MVDNLCPDCPIDTIIQGDALTVLKTLPDEFIDCCVTSPPYWGLRDYGVEGQLGLEKTPEEYVAKMVEVFRETRRVLKKEGTCWVNIGDSYATSPPGNKEPPKDEDGVYKRRMDRQLGHGEDANKIWHTPKSIGLKPKDLVGIPWRVAFALQADGWYLRQDIIWHKPNPMPESVTDRCTKAHEYVFLMAKSKKYYFDNEAIKEPVKDSSVARLIQDVEGQQGSGRVPGKTNGPMKAVKFGGNKQCPDTRLQSGKEWNPKMAGGGTNIPGHAGYFKADGTPFNGLMVNKKSVWTVTTKPFKGAHFATFPPDLIEPMILAGCPEGGIVLDPFIGSGTTAKVAVEHRRRYIGIDLNTQYVEMAEKRRQTTQRLFV